PGLAAKPVIDIMVGVLDLDSSRHCIDHLVPTGFWRFTEVLAFRDYLRAHPHAAWQYEQLKRKLAIRYADDRQAYTDGKSAMVAAVTADACTWLAVNQPR